jgi:hypothetical protein
MITLIKWLVDVQFHLPRFANHNEFTQDFRFFQRETKFYFNIYIWHLMVIDIDIGFLKEKS